MKCVSCGEKTEIVDTQKFDTVVWRKRRCLVCKHAVCTHETVVEVDQWSRVKERKDRAAIQRAVGPLLKKGIEKKQIVEELEGRPNPDAVTLRLSRQEERLFTRLLEMPASTPEIQQSMLEISNVSGMVQKINAKLKMAGDKRTIVCEMQPYENQFGEITRVGFWRIGDGVMPKATYQRIEDLVEEKRMRRELEDEFSEA